MTALCSPWSGYIHKRPSTTAILQPVRPGSFVSSVLRDENVEKLCRDNEMLRQKLKGTRAVTITGPRGLLFIAEDSLMREPSSMTTRIFGVSIFHHH